MKFENDIFISYTHDDNLTFNKKDTGWIDEFSQCLLKRVAQVSGIKPKIWKDEKLKGNDYFDDTIEDEIAKSAILISIFSPRYLTSEWCLRELQEFCSKSGDIRVGNKSRLFKIIKYPLEHKSNFPSEVQRLLGYEFHTKTPPGPPIELTPSIEEYQKDYTRILTDLAESIKEVLKLLRSDNSQLTLPNQSTGSTIYLAKTTFDLKEERDKIRRELQQFGHTVLPDEDLPDYSPAFEEAVQQSLEQSQLSVHLLGERYGLVLSPSGLSMTELQYKLAVECEQINPDFKHLTWFPTDSQAKETRQEEFISEVQNDSEYLRTSLEELKTIIQDKLKPKTETQEASTLSKIFYNQPIYIYLIHDQSDKVEDISPLYNYFMDLPNFEIRLPDFSGNEAEIRQAHIENLKSCDAAILYYGKGNLAWLQSKLSGFSKVMGYGREQPMLAQAVYIAEPQAPEKNLFRTKQALVIKDFDEFSPELLNDFLTQIEQNLGEIK